MAAKHSIFKEQAGKYVSFLYRFDPGIMALERGLKVCCGRHIAAQAVVKMLSEEGILIDPSETGNVRGKQVKLGEKGWHYAFDLEMLIERLVERGYAVPERVIETFCG